MCDETRCRTGQGPEGRGHRNWSQGQRQHGSLIGNLLVSGSGRWTTRLITLTGKVRLATSLTRGGWMGACSVVAWWWAGVTTAGDITSLIFGMVRYIWPLSPCSVTPHSCLVEALRDELASV